jgi:DNA polymerase-1
VGDYAYGMRVVIDIEANGLKNPSKIWLTICKDIDSGKYYTFYPYRGEDENNSFRNFWKRVSLAIGHNWLGYDWIHLNRLVGKLDEVPCIDTLVVSKLVDFSRKGHSIEDYGEEFNLPKGSISDFGRYSEELEVYCRRDIDITERIYRKHLRYIENPVRRRSIETEQAFQLVCNDLENNGFAFNTAKAQQLLDNVQKELSELDADILSSFPPREVLIREFTPKETKYGTISKTSVPRSLWANISEYEVGKTYRHCRSEEFNPSSHKQIISVLTEAGWNPVAKTKTHIELEREINKLERERPLDPSLPALYTKLNHLKKFGWKVNEENLETLPPRAPQSARSLAKRILLESRRRTLTEWLDLVDPDDGRIHGRFYGIGAWTHRMAHQAPNTANIPNEFDTGGKRKLLGKELRALWCAPKNRLLVGCDAEGIQLRIFAHYIDDPEFTQSLVNGKKEDKSDPHSLNQSILGPVCKSRAAAKRYIYALLLGAGQGKLREILDCDEKSAGEAYERLLARYTGFAYLKEKVIPADAKRGWFVGLDGRAVRIPGEAVGSRRHLAMSGYLQNGEAVAMKLATLKWWPRLKEFDAKIVNFVHDEWQVECPNDTRIALEIAKMMSQSLSDTGTELGLKCPLAGSYWNDDLKDYTIATNWSKTH